MINLTMLCHCYYAAGEGVLQKLMGNGSRDHKRLYSQLIFAVMEDGNGSCFGDGSAPLKCYHWIICNSAGIQKQFLIPTNFTVSYWPVSPTHQWRLGDVSSNVFSHSMTAPLLSNEASSTILILSTMGIGWHQYFEETSTEILGDHSILQLSRGWKYTLPFELTPSQAFS